MIENYNPRLAGGTTLAHGDFQGELRVSALLGARIFIFGAGACFADLTYSAEQL